MNSSAHRLTGYPRGVGSSRLLTNSVVNAIPTGANGDGIAIDGAFVGSVVEALRRSGGGDPGSILGVR